MRYCRNTLLAIGVVATLTPFAMSNAAGATTTTVGIGADAPGVTAIDGAIERFVAQRITVEQLSPADSALAREQLRLQFLSMSASKQREIIHAARGTGEESAIRAVQMLKSSVEFAARQVIAARSQASSEPAIRQQSTIQPKFGATDSNLVFVATTGPCRVADTRNNLAADWPGQIPGGTARQIYAYSTTPAYAWSNQGGNGTPGSGNCAATLFFGASPVEVVATVTVVNTSSFGALQAWNGGPTLTTGAVLVWGAGDLVANTTVIPLDRLAALYPGSGPYKRDFAVNNNSPTPIDVVVDVVGYFVHNNATALECTTVGGTSTSVPAFTGVFLAPPACPAGYAAMTPQPYTPAYGFNAGTLNLGGCRLNNMTGGALNGACDAFCCRVPGL